MKLKSYSGSGVETNSKNESLDFGIGDPSVIIEILRNRLYSNPIRTLVQEYICNARDAHREAGKELEPIHVGLPSSSNLVFSVTDFGCGLSPDQVKNIFVNYGTSTKRGSDKLTGGFGIGAKSAWAYTDNFMIKAIFGGYERHYIAHIGTKNNGVLDKVYENKTDKPNQTTVEIAIKASDCSNFIYAALRATMFWKVRPVFNGSGKEFSDWNYSSNTLAGPSWYYNMKPTYKLDKLEFYENGSLGEEFKCADDYWNSGLYLIVDEIPYHIGRNFTESYSELISLLNGENIICVRVGNSDCEVSASREQISDSSESKNRIKSVLSDLALKLKTEVAGKLEKISSFFEFKQFCLDNHNLLSFSFSSGFQFDGWYLSGSGIGGYRLKNNSLDISEIKFDYYTNEKRSSRKSFGKSGEGKIVLSKKTDCTVGSYGIPLNSEHFYYIDEEISNSNLRDSIREVYTQEIRSGFILFSGKEKLGCFETKSISSVKRKKKVSKPRALNQFSVDVYNPSMCYFSSKKNNFYRIKLDGEQKENNKRTYVYHVLQDGREYPHYYDIAHYIRNYSDVMFCVVSKKYENKVKGYPGFVEDKEFFKNFKSYIGNSSFNKEFISNEIKTRFVSKIGSPQFYFIKTNIDKIDDQSLKEFFSKNSSYLLEDKNDRYNNFGWVLRFSLNEDKEISETLVEADSIVSKISEKYPLLEIISIYENLNSDPFKNEILLYINSKNR